MIAMGFSAFRNGVRRPPRRENAGQVTILRPRKRMSRQLEIEATLGRCPEKIVRVNRILEIPAQLMLAKQQFPEWWARHFGMASGDREE